jgi:hypothetical protein
MMQRVFGHNMKPGYHIYKHAGSRRYSLLHHFKTPVKLTRVRWKVWVKGA